MFQIAVKFGDLPWCKITHHLKNKSISGMGKYHLLHKVDDTIPTVDGSEIPHHLGWR